ncbi:MAG: ATP-binding protein [Clostridiales bacterium]|uniref:sensor histidine kinase n=1 Tax=Terrisporobacter sp. TaxID=1965305 RepID=UPI002A383DDC|nr:ATP-binding protein [Terrisporobacter sp.]MCI5629470.1 ATP-binding protein [Clostridium sp.]MDD5878221.1 ATP-binding protein [Clostridiales bacterium]MCI6457496.1 ATP-binding protein [Clostridium sp.]MCI7205866.1 ATP-binding protein [Clostridium sp.]MDD7754784.1 ATP-binding protein [Clostridiales bacterium]
MDFNKKKLNLNKKLIFYLAIVMISVIVIMSLSINLSVKNKILYYSQSISNLSSEELIKYRDLILKDMKNLIIGISLLMIIVVIAVSVFLSQKISKPIIVVSKMTDFIKMGGYDQKLEYESSIVEIDNLINSINELSRELYKMENMRKNLTSDISHELRTPLTSIQTHLEAMIDGIWEPSKERLNSVNEEVIRLSHLVNQLKNLAKFDSYEDKLNLKNENLTQLIKNIIYNNESYALDKNIRIKYELEDVNANIDKEKISQVIINLISNAIRYTNLNGEILIKLYKKSDFIKIIVKDNGIGIPEESLDYIFERFYRVDKSRCRNTGGTGVGLTICKSIVDLHKGKIEVKSKLNEGSEFIITLPN